MKYEINIPIKTLLINNYLSECILEFKKQIIVVFK